MMNFLLSASLTADNASASGVGAYLIATLAAVVIGFLAIVVELMAVIKLYRKIGVSPWVIFVPIYSSYVFFKAYGVRKWFWIMALLYAAIMGVSYMGIPYFKDEAALIMVMYVLFCAFFTIFAIGALYYTYNMARAFGKGFSFFCGLLILSPIFYLILAFGKSEYIGVPQKE